MRNAMMILGAGLLAGFSGAYGVIVGEQLAQENMFHTEYFEAIVIDGDGFYGEPVTEDGLRIHGEGVFLEVDMVPIEVNKGDIVSVSWTNAQAEHGDWQTPAKVELEEEK